MTFTLQTPRGGPKNENLGICSLHWNPQRLKMPKGPLVSVFAFLKPLLSLTNGAGFFLSKF